MAIIVTTDSPFGGTRLDSRGGLGFTGQQITAGSQPPSIDIGGINISTRTRQPGGTLLTPGEVVSIGGQVIEGDFEGAARTLGSSLAAGPAPLVGTGACPGLFSVRGPDGTCINLGDLGPGGSPAVTAQTPSFGGAVIGAFGIPALQPAVVGQINGRPIRKCPLGAVLGKDDLCYQKGSIPKQFRKWRPAPRPPMTAADAKALRRIGTLQKKVKGLAKSANLTCKRK